MTEKPLVDIVRELTDITSRVELYDHDRIGLAVHTTESPSLITQLRVAMTQSASVDGGTKPGFGSKPSARLDAIDALLRIDQGATRWLHTLTRTNLEPATLTSSCPVIVWAAMGSVFRCTLTPLDGHETCIRHGNRRSRPRITVDSPTEDLVRKLAAASLHNDAVERDIRAWWLHAQIVTGWESPAFRPNNTCPNCKKRGGLRVRVDRQEGHVTRWAMCVECKAQWTGEDDTFDALAMHVRIENHDETMADA